MRNICLVIAYDGTAYSGWQIQSHVPTIQGKIEAVLKHMTKSHCRLRCAGRTDAGVHAQGQVANFRTESNLDCYKFLHGLNSLLPPDITILSAKEVPLDFNSAQNNIGKHYRYSIWNTRKIFPAYRKTACHRYSPLDLQKMAQAALALVGQHDFSAFRAADCESETTIRTLYRCTISADGPIVYIDVEGTAFLKNMVRIIAGTLIEIGADKLPVETTKELLESKDRTKAGFTAPAHGLSLMQVFLP